MIFRATAVAAIFLVSLLSSQASFAQSVLTVKHALDIVSEVRPAVCQNGRSTHAAEKSQAPADKAPLAGCGVQGNGKGAPESRHGLP